MEPLFYTTEKGRRALDDYFEGFTRLPRACYSVLDAAMNGASIPEMLKAAKTYSWMGERLKQSSEKAISTVERLLDDDYISEAGDIWFEDFKDSY